jgi:hypothetical protein
MIAIVTPPHPPLEDYDELGGDLGLVERQKQANGRNSASHLALIGLRTMHRIASPMPLDSG